MFVRRRCGPGTTLLSDPAPGYLQDWESAREAPLWSRYDSLLSAAVEQGAAESLHQAVYDELTGTAPQAETVSELVRIQVSENRL